jgi:hypothetical protein
MAPRTRRSLLLSTGVLSAATAGCVDRAATTSDRLVGRGLDGPHRVDIEETGREAPDDAVVSLSHQVHETVITEDDPARVSVTVENDGDEAVTLGSFQPWPFGVVILDPTDGGESVTLWTDSYRESDAVRTRGRHVQSASDAQVANDLPASESFTEEYGLYTDSRHLEAGSYETFVSTAVDRGDVEGSHRINVEVTVEPE